MNKKATIFNVIHFILRIFFLTIVVAVIVLLVRSYVISEVDIFDAESRLFVQRILFSGGISYSDTDTNRLYPGIIDLEKFDPHTIKETLDKSIYYGDENRQIAAKITLEDIDGNVKSIIFNEEWFDKWMPLARTRVPGPGGARSITRKLYVLIKDNDELKNGILSIEVVIPNT